MSTPPRARGLLDRAWDAVERFAFTPASAAPLAVLRIGLAAVLLAQAAVLAPVFFDLYASWGIVQGPIRDALTDRSLPCLGWLVDAFARVGVGEAPVLAGSGLVYLLALLALLVGFRTRAAAVVAWLVHVMLMTSAQGSTYGIDQIASVLLFYLVWMPAGAVLSLDRRRLPAAVEPPPLAGFALRVLQIHLCIIYLISGVAKALGPSWWDGNALWRSLVLPEYSQLDFSWLAQHPWAARAGGWAALLVEAGYPVLIWPRRTRRIWVAAVGALHLGIGLFMGLHLFGAIMVVSTLAAFGVPADPTAAPPQAVARQWALRLLALLGSFVLLAEVLATAHAAPPGDEVPVPFTDLTPIEDGPTTNAGGPRR